MGEYHCKPLITTTDYCNTVIPIPFELKTKFVYQIF